MKSMRRLFLALLFFVVATLAGFARATEISVGGRKIVIPTPSGFVPAESVAPAFLNERKELALPGVKFLTGFIERADAERLVAGEEPLFEHYILLAETPALKNANISQNDFQAMKAEIRKSFEELPEIVERKKAEFERMVVESLPETEFEIDGVIPLGVDREDAAFLSGSFLMKTVFSFGSTKNPVVLVCSLSIVRVRQRIVFAYVYGSYRTRSDAENVRRVAHSLVTGILRANRTESLPDIPDLPGDASKRELALELLQEEAEPFSIAGHPKAKGLEAAVSFPKSWQRKEAARPNIVQTFHAPSGNDLLVSGMILVYDAPGVTRELIEMLNPDDLPDEKELQDFLPRGATLRRGGTTSIDGTPAFWVEYFSKTERVGLELYVRSLSFFILCDEKALMLTFSVGASAKSQEDADAVFEVSLPLFRRIAASTVLVSKWKQ